MSLLGPIWKSKQALAAFFAHQKLRRKDVAQRDIAVRGPIYVANKVASAVAGSVYNDVIHGWKKRITHGRIALGQKAAIYLIFPDRGLLQSHKAALAYIISKGFAPLVVSNVALSESDRSSLADISYLLVERVNYGYDFGGYRDGVLALRKQLKSMEYIAFFNDSTWFPIGVADWLGQAEAMHLDLVGASWGNFAHASRLQDIDQFEFSFDPKFRTFHYQSYALLCGSAFLRSPKFLAYWQWLGLSQLKHLTIRRGEIGFSQLAIRNGFRHGATLDPKQMQSGLQALSDADLSKLLTTLPLQPGDENLPVERARANQASKMDRNLAIKVVLLGMSRHSVTNFGFRYLIDQMHFGFLKKQTLWLSPDSAIKATQFIQHLDTPLGDIIRQEATMLTQSKNSC